ncbi:MAG: FMN-binding protein [Christensenellales bacterium]
MKKGFLYTVLFMVILSALLTFALAFSYEAFKPSIAQHKQLRLERAVLYAFGLEEGLTDSQVHEKFQAQVDAEGLNGQPGYSLKEKGQTTAYAVPFEGAGLWGTIRGYLGVTAALDRTTGLVFIDQNETPGLGGRIDELQYKEQFRGLPLNPGITLVYGQGGEDGIDAITGATQTSSAVLRIVNRAIAASIFTGEGK